MFWIYKHYSQNGKMREKYKCVWMFWYISIDNQVRDFEIKSWIIK